MEMVSVFDQLANIAQIARRCPTPVLSRAFVRSYREFCDQTRWLTTNIDGATEADVRQYNLGSDPYLQIIAVRAVRASYTPASGPVQYWPLTPTDPTRWNQMIGSQRPTGYTYVPHGQIALNPVPDKAYGLLVEAVLQPKTETVAQVPSQVLAQYSNEIEAGALAYLLALPGEPWTNPAMAAQYARQFQAGVNNGKAEVQRSHNMGSQRARGRGFIVR